jgi:hypothetical protein
MTHFEVWAIWSMLQNSLYIFLGKTESDEIGPDFLVLSMVWQG